MNPILATALAATAATLHTGEIKLSDEWDKTFPKSSKVEHAKVAFKNRFGIILAADVYKPKEAQGKLPALAVCGPFGAVKEQASGLYAQTLAERGFLAIVFDPSYTGESGGEPRHVASVDLSTEDFSAAIDYLSTRGDADGGRIGVVGICGWGGFALNAAAVDTRIQATVAVTLYDMHRLIAKGYNDSADSPAARRTIRERLSKQRTADALSHLPPCRAGGVVDPLPADAPQFVRDYHAYYKRPRGFHPRSLNSTEGFNLSSRLALVNTPILAYAEEIESAVLVVHGELAHSRYFGETGFARLKGSNKELLIVPGASHCDLYDGGGKGAIPFDAIEAFLRKHLSGREERKASAQEVGKIAPAELTPREAALADVGAATALGDEGLLRASFAACFDAGVTLSEAKEAVGHLYAYCGFPRALNAASVLMKCAAERHPTVGKEGAEPFVLRNSFEVGSSNQTRLCGREIKGGLFAFHPQLDAYLKAHLFGDLFNRKLLDWRTRELLTIAALAACPETVPQLKSHLAVGRLNGISRAQAEAILRRVRRPEAPESLPRNWSPIPVGKPNLAYSAHFTGRSYLHPLATRSVGSAGVAFAPSCRNDWHIHRADSGGGQILIVTAGTGLYQEWGRPARKLVKGDAVFIAPAVKHWHGAAPDEWFQHIAIEVPGTNASTQWLERVADSDYLKAAQEARAIPANL